MVRNGKTLMSKKKTIENRSKSGSAVNFANFSNHALLQCKIYVQLS